MEKIMITIKICDNSHLKQAVDMAYLKEKNGGIPQADLNDFQAIFEKYLSSNNNYLMIGAFEEEELISFVCVAFWKYKDPCWFITFMFTKKFSNQFSFSRPEIGLLIKAAFEIADHRHYWKYSYSIASKHELLYDKLWKNNKFVDLGRYNLTIEQVIAKDTPAKRDRHWRLLGSRIIEIDTVIKCRILKKELRKKYDSLHLLEIEARHKNYEMYYPQLNFEESNKIDE